MKKITEIIKPFMAIIFGALLFLTYLNCLSSQDSETLAIGVIAMVMAAFYLFVGIFGAMGGKLYGTGKKVMDAITISAFPLFMGVSYLLTLIDNAKDFAAAETALPIGAWVIGILSVGGALAFGVLYIVSCFVRNKVVKRFAQLFALVFVLVLILDILFTDLGSPVALGNIVVLLVVINIAYCDLLFTSFPLLEKESAKEKKEEKAEEPAKEE